MTPARGCVFVFVLLAFSGVAAVAPPGQLLKVAFQSNVGILLTDVPVGAARDTLATTLLNAGAAFWQLQAVSQTRLLLPRLTAYRRIDANADGTAQLPLPPESVWQITLTGPPQRMTFSANNPTGPTFDYIAQNFSFSSVLIGEVTSFFVTDQRLVRSGAATELFLLPRDPNFLLTRLGTACASPQRPANVDVEDRNYAAWFDDGCTAATSFSLCYALPCGAALDSAVSASAVTVQWQTLPWNATFANQWRVGTHTATAPELNPSLSPLSAPSIKWVYLDPTACPRRTAGCPSTVTAAGWRRLLRFESLTANTGKTAFVAATLSDPNYIAGGVVQSDPCEPDITRSALFTASTSVKLGATVVVNAGNCFRGTTRAFNTESTPFTHNLDSCSASGIPAGWGFMQPIGTGCQWADITAVRPGTYQLRYTFNPLRLLCEGTPQLNPLTGLSAFVSIRASDSKPYTIERCVTTIGSVTNDVVAFSIAVPAPQISDVLLPCTATGFTASPARDCAFKVMNDNVPCLAGNMVSLHVQHSDPSVLVILRACPVMSDSGVSSQCVNAERLGSAAVVANPTTTPLTFLCPTGANGIASGIYSILVSAFALDSVSPVATAAIPPLTVV